MMSHKKPTHNRGKTHWYSSRLNSTIQHILTILLIFACLCGFMFVIEQIRNPKTLSTSNTSNPFFEKGAIPNATMGMVFKNLSLGERTVEIQSAYETDTTQINQKVFMRVVNSPATSILDYITFNATPTTPSKNIQSGLVEVPALINTESDNPQGTLHGKLYSNTTAYPFDKYAIIINFNFNQNVNSNPLVFKYTYQNHLDGYTINAQLQDSYTVMFVIQHDPKGLTIIRITLLLLFLYCSWAVYDIFSRKERDHSILVAWAYY